MGLMTLDELIALNNSYIDDTKPPLKVFLSGSKSHEEFIKLSKSLKNLGFIVFDQYNSGERESFSACLNWICFSDAVYFIENWQILNKSIAEHAVAQALNLALVYEKESNDRNTN